MPRFLVAFLLFGLLFPAQETVPSGITCCDEQQIRRAMTEEALRRIAIRNEGRAREETDYLCVQAHERIRRLLPAGGREQVLDFMRQALHQADPDEDTREFQELVGHFILGMTLEIGHTFQDEYDLALAARERVGRLLGELEAHRDPGAEVLGRALFRADMTERELRRLRTLPGKWRPVKEHASPFDEFNILKRNVTARPADPDQGPAFRLAEAYNDRFSFLDEFLGNYRQLAADFLEAARRVNERLARIEE